MEAIGGWITGVVEVGLAPVLVLLLLWKGFDLMNRWIKQFYEVQIGLRIILEKLNATEEYDKAITELKEREEL